MTPDETHAAVMKGLERLPRLAPDPRRAERVRMTCRAKLGRARKRTARTAAIGGFAWRVLAPMAVGAFCVLYVVALVTTAFRLENVAP